MPQKPLKYIFILQVGWWLRSYLIQWHLLMLSFDPRPKRRAFNGLCIRKDNTTQRSIVSNFFHADHFHFRDTRQRGRIVYCVSKLSISYRVWCGQLLETRKCNGRVGNSYTGLYCLHLWWRMWILVHHYDPSKNFPTGYAVRTDLKKFPPRWIMVCLAWSTYYNTRPNTLIVQKSA